MSSRQRDEQLALFGLANVDRRRPPDSEVSPTVADQPNDATGPAAPTLDASDIWGCPDCGAESGGA